MVSCWLQTWLWLVLLMNYSVMQDKVRHARLQSDCVSPSKLTKTQLHNVCTNEAQTYNASLNDAVPVREFANTQKHRPANPSEYCKSNNGSTDAGHQAVST
jgi:hypothetical protein